jgi:hypothetical protein
VDAKAIHQDRAVLHVNVEELETPGGGNAIVARTRLLSHDRQGVVLFFSTQPLLRGAPWARLATRRPPLPMHPY